MRLSVAEGGQESTIRLKATGLIDESVDLAGRVCREDEDDSIMYGRHQRTSA